MALLAHGYPGNVRELRNIIERASLLADSGRIDLQHLPSALLDGLHPLRDARGAGSALPALRTVERDALVQALERHGGNRRELAVTLGLSERTLYRKLREYDLGRRNKRLDP
jgi:transcriptional regulator of acetoin/glycerol metabolism